MNILVTGSKGFIGSHLVPLLKKRHNVFEFDFKDDLNIFDDSINDIVMGVDMVIHLAALTSVSGSFEKPGDNFYVNVLGTAKIVQACIDHKKKLIFPSSAAVYIPETSPYAYSKKLAEDLVWEARHSIPVTILRLYNVFGPNMNPDSGSIMYRFLHDKEIIVHGTGEQTRDFIHVRDVVSTMEMALDESWDYQIVDVGTGKANTINYVAELFKFYTGKEIKYIEPQREVKWSIASTYHLMTLRNKPLTTNLEEDIKELCQKQVS